MGSFAISTPTGTKLNKVGRRTGWTSGSVTNTCYDVPQANTYVDGKPTLMKCSYMVSASTAGGDSGSPVFSRELYGGMYGHRLHGILWGGTSSSFVFSHITKVRSELDLGQVDAD